MQTRRALRLVLAACAAAVVAACGGGDDDSSAAPANKYARLVSFGDSLSDVGTYATPGLVTATGGGRYTVNAASSRVWVEVLAKDWIGVAVPCAAVVGLESAAGTAFADFAAPRTAKPGCTGYAQGGARVTNAIGPWNKALLQQGDPSGALGQLTEPVVAQISNHLASNGGKFAADDLVTVLAGNNDLFVVVAEFQASLRAGVPQADAAQAAAVKMATAGGELAGLIKSQMVAKGARRVVVLNMPDASGTPNALATEAAQPGTAAFVRQLVQAFNAQLATGLSGTAGVLQVDAYARTQALARNPASSNITNATTPACANFPAAGRPVSLFCNSTTLIPGDVSRYAYADDVHPTPYVHRLVAAFVAEEMAKAGWL